MTLKLKGFVRDTQGAALSGKTVKLYEVTGLTESYLGGTYADVTSDAAGAWEFTGLDESKQYRGRALAGSASSDQQVWDMFSGQADDLQVRGVLRVAGSSVTELIFAQYTANDSNGASVRLLKSRGTLATPTIVSNNDYIGGITAKAYDGANWQTVAGMVAFVDGTPGAGDMPGRLQFYTTPDGSATTLERMRITQAGLVGIGGAGNAVVPIGALHIHSANPIYIDRAGPSHVLLRGSNGTVAAPTAITSGSVLGRLSFNGYDGAAWSDMTTGVAGIASENWSGSARGTRLSFTVTPNGSVIAAEKARLEQDGQFLVDDGSLSNPGFSFIAGPDTGVRRAGANDMRLVAGANDRLMVDADEARVYFPGGSVSGGFFVESVSPGSVLFKVTDYVEALITLGATLNFNSGFVENTGSINAWAAAPASTKARIPVFYSGSLWGYIPVYV